jgi:hypothetical protein
MMSNISHLFHIPVKESCGSILPLANIFFIGLPWDGFFHGLKLVSQFSG